MELDPAMQERARGCAVGAAVGDALGMPLEFGPRQPAGSLVREMRSGRIPAGTFTDDTEMALALKAVGMPEPLRAVVAAAPDRRREELKNSGWVRHTLESAVWGLLTTGSFEEAVIQVVNLGNDADTVGAVVGALARAAFGLEAIPDRWRDVLQGEWPLKSGMRWSTLELVSLADQLLGCALGMCLGTI